MTDASQAASGGTDLYRAYETWKGWDHPFTFSRDDAAYYAGECRDLRLKDAALFEIGFGSGGFLEWARTRGAHVVGSEINPASLEAARSRGIELLPADFERVAATHSERFDTVVSFDVFEHFSLDEITTRLAAVETMLKPGGLFLMRFPNAQSPFGLAPQNGDPTHRTGLSRDVFELLVQPTGFEIVRYGGSYRIGGGGLVRGPVRLVRGVIRGLIGGLLNFAYATAIPYDPVVVIVLRRRARQGDA